MDIGPSVNPDVLKQVNGHKFKLKDGKMPLKSAKQYHFMQMMAHNPDSAKKNVKGKKGKGIGPSPEKAEEMIHKTPASKRKQFARAKK